MKKKNKFIIGALSILFSALALTGCTKSFCTVDDNAHMLYAYDYGVTEYYDSNVEGTTKLFNDNNNIYYKLTPLENMPSTSGIGSANNNANSAGAPIPSLTFWKALDDVVLENALNKAGLSSSTVSYSDLFNALDTWGYQKFSGTEENNELFANFDVFCNVAKTRVSIDDAPTKDYLNNYKSALSGLISAKRSCFSIDDNAYGYYGYKSGTGFRPEPGSVTMSKKTWGNAWKQGLFQGLLVYPIGWLTETFAGIFTGHNNANLQQGWPQLLALLVVTFIVRGLMLLVTFKQTASNAKMQGLQGEMAKIQAKYPNANTNQNEKQRMAMEMQKLYKKNGINPFGSILILIVQFPVFICVWGALQGSASLATGSVLGMNLSEPISSYIFAGECWKNGSAFTALGLFLIMAGTQVVSMLLPQWIQKKKEKQIAKLGRNPAKKEQDNKMKWFTYIMMAMIIIMGFTLASAMGVYWFVGALFSIVQTLITNKINKAKA